MSTAHAVCKVASEFLPMSISAQRVRCGTLGLVSLCLLLSNSLLRADDNDSTLALRLRSRVETAPKSGKFNTITRPEKWDAAQDGRDRL